MSDKATCAIYAALCALNFGLFIAWPDTALAPFNWLAMLLMLVLALRSLSRL